MDKKEAETHELELLRKRVRRRMNDYADDMIGGAAKDFAEYRYMVGVQVGLAMAERDLLDLDDELIRD